MSFESKGIRIVLARTVDKCETCGVTAPLEEGLCNVCIDKEAAGWELECGFSPVEARHAALEHGPFDGEMRQ
jgi:hypothetical protein